MINYFFLVLLFLAFIGLLLLIRSNLKQEKFIKKELENGNKEKKIK